MPDGCTQSGTTGTVNTLTITSSMRGLFVVAGVTATKTGTSLATVKFSKSTPAVREKPVNTVAPTITAPAPAITGSSYAVNNGTWTGFGTVTFPSYAWYSCTTATPASASLPAGCTVISGALGQTYTPAAALAGKRLVAEVKAQNDAQTATVSMFTASTPVLLEPVKNTVAPKISLVNPATTPNGAPTATGTLTTSAGTWTGSATISYSYVWYRCPSPASSAPASLPVDCVAIGGANTANYSTAVADVGSHLLVAVTANNGANIAQTAYSTSVGPVSRSATVTTDPVISGSRIIGTAHTVSSGTWGNAVPDISSYTYEWLACSASVPAATNSIPASNNCLSVQPTTAAAPATYTPKAADDTKFLVVKVTPVNGAPATPRFTASTGAIGLVPKNTAPPTYSVTNGVNGAPSSRGTVIAATGTWTASPAATKSFLWYLCDSAVATTSSTLPPSCRALTTDDGVNPATATITVSKLWGGKFLSVAETASNVLGSATQWSVATKAVNVPAELTQEPLLTGTPIDGNQLGVTNVSTFGFTAPVVAYQWYRCSSAQSAAPPAVATAPTGCTAISTATASTYNLVWADAGKFVIARVGVTNSDNTTGSFRWTKSTTVITSQPKNTVRPTITVTGPSTAGRPKFGGSVSTTGGTWTGFPAVTLTYQWYSCDGARTGTFTELPSGCAKITTADGSTRSLSMTNALVGSHVIVEVTATNEGFPPQVTYSESVGQVTKPAVVTSTPALGLPDNSARYVGQTYTFVPGSFTDGTPAVVAGSKVITWLRCTSEVTQQLASAAARPAGCTAIRTGSVGGSYVTVDADKGKFVTVEEAWQNEAGVATSVAVSGSRPVAALPTNTVAPSVSGSAWVGKVLTANDGTWIGPPSPTVTRQWMTCASSVATSTQTEPSGCSVIQDGSGNPITSPTYTLVDTDISDFILVKVTATTDAGSVTRYSATVGPIRTKPAVVTYPFIKDLDVDNTNTGIVGWPHVATSGTWTGSAPLATPTFQWYLCTSAISVATTVTPSGCTAIANAKASSYTPVAADAGKYLTVAVTETNNTEPVTAWARSTPGPVSTAISAPNPAPAVSVSGGNGSTPQLGGSVTVSNGVWAATPAVAYAYQWFACTANVVATATSLPAGCSPIAQATDNKLELGLERTDIIGKFLLAKVTAYHPLTPKNSNLIYTKSTAAVQSKPQVNAPASLGGVPYVGATLTATPGSSFSLPAATPGYQWLRCTAAISQTVSSVPSECTQISGATASTYVVKNDPDLGQRIAVRVTWTNTLGNAVSVSTTTALIVLGPVNTSAPRVDALGRSNPVAGYGVRVQSVDADWIGSFPQTRTYQWYRCTTLIATASDSLPAGCASIDGAQLADYSVTGDDVQNYLVAGVTATNVDGQSTKFSASSTQVYSMPTLAQDPVTSGKPFIGTKQTTTSGTWLGFPSPTFTYEWYACTTAQSASDTNGATCVETPVSTSTTYTPPIEQNGRTLRVKVTAKNGAGDVVRWTPTTETLSEGPYIITPATIAGTADVGSTTPLRVTAGAWGGNSYPNIVGQWLRCGTRISAPVVGDAYPSQCSPIDGQTGPNYTLRAADAGMFISFIENASNEHGADGETSASTAQVTMAPTVVDEPGISGPAEVGASLTRVAGTWIGYPTPENTSTDAITWWQCSSAVATATSTQPTQCTRITGETGNSYKVRDVDLNKYIVYRETKKNGPTGTIIVNRYSASTVIVSAPPVRKTDVTITSADRLTNVTPRKVAPVVGKTISAVAGTWTGVSGTQGITHRWYRCDAAVTTPSDVVPTGCVLSGASDAAADSYAVSPADLGKFLVTEETATNVAATRVRYSVSTLVVQELPSVVEAPTISGTRAIASPAQVLTLNRGTWAGTANVSTTVEWYRCTEPVSDPNTLPTTCTFLAGQISDTYAITTADAAQYVTARIVAKNPATDLAAPASVNYLVPVSSADITARAPVAPTVASMAPALTLKEVAGSTDVGKPSAGDAYQVTTGTWSGAAPTPTYAYAWYTCSTSTTTPSNDVPSSCTVVPDETGNELVLTTAMLGTFVLARVTATNAAGSDSKNSASSTVAVAEGLAFSVAPSVSPTTSYVLDANATQTVTADSGAWTPAGSTQTYQWLSCPKKVTSTAYSTPPGCTIITGKDNAPLVLTSAQSGRFITTVTTAKRVNNNALDQRRVIAVSTDMVLEAPSNVAVPTVSGKAVVGEKLTVAIGTWRGAEVPAKTISWYRCTAAVSTAGASGIPAGCSIIDNAISATYTVTSADREKFIAARVVATNVSGSAASFSTTTEQVQFIPVNLTAPSISGRPYVGQSVSVNLGTWDGDPDPLFQVDWFTCSAQVTSAANTVPAGICSKFGSTTTELPTATTSSTTLPSGVSQRYVLAKVTAVNTAGSAIMSSATSQQIWESPNIPAGNTKPNLSGTANVGQRLTVNNGAWSAFPNPTPSYEWWVCTSAVTQASPTLSTTAGCVKSSVSTAYYDLAQSDGGKFVVAGVTQTNSAGTGTYFSSSTVAIGYPPRATVAPSIVPRNGPDFDYVGQQLDALEGTWSGQSVPVDPVAPKNKYQWYTCSVVIAAPMDALPSGSVCTPISGAINQTLTLTVNEAGKNVAVLVTKRNAVNANNVSAWVQTPATVEQFGTKLSASRLIRQAPVANESTTTLTGAADVGKTVTASSTTWKGTPTPVVADTGIEWYVCDASTTAIESCTLLTTETSRTITVKSEYAGKYLKTRAWAKNSVGTTYTTPVGTQRISEAPVLVAAPVITSNPTQPRVGDVFTATTGTWRSTAGGTGAVETKTFTYAWFSCVASADAVGSANCVRRVADSSTATSYVAVSADAGRYITAVVKAQNLVNSTASGTTTASSAVVSSQSNYVGQVYVAPSTSDSLTLASSGGSANSVGNTLSVSGEAWSAVPSVDTVAYDWFACTNAVSTRPPAATPPAGCTKIENASASTFVLTEAQGNLHVMARVTATNVVASTIRWTTSRGPVTMSPQVIANPTLAGTAKVGQQLIATKGTWKGFPSPTLGYAWFACDAAEESAPASRPSTCVQLAGQSQTTLTLTAGMNVVGKHILVAETATNSVGAVTAFSTTLGAVVAADGATTPTP